MKAKSWIKKTFINRHSDRINIKEVQRLLIESKPSLYSSKDIHRFLQDLGRNEINSRISQCVEELQKWRGVLKILRYKFNENDISQFLRAEKISHDNFDGELFQECIQELETYIEAKKVFWLWKHNLNILEMSAQAQFYLSYKSNKHQ